MHFDQNLINFYNFLNQFLQYCPIHFNHPVRNTIFFLFSEIPSILVTYYMFQKYILKVQTSSSCSFSDWLHIDDYRANETYILNPISSRLIYFRCCPISGNLTWWRPIQVMYNLTIFRLEKNYVGIRHIRTCL